MPIMRIEENSTRIDGSRFCSNYQINFKFTTSSGSGPNIIIIRTIKTEMPNDISCNIFGFIATAKLATISKI